MDKPGNEVKQPMQRDTMQLNKFKTRTTCVDVIALQDLFKSANITAPGCDQHKHMCLYDKDNSIKVPASVATLYWVLSFEQDVMDDVKV